MCCSRHEAFSKDYRNRTEKMGCAICLAPEKDDTLCHFVKYHLHYAVTKQRAYLIPRIDNCIDSLGVTTIFTGVDENSEYWQAEMEKADRGERAITSHHGLYRFIRMSFWET